MFRQGPDFHFQISEVQITRVNCMYVVNEETAQITRATTSDNVPSACAPRKDSDQPIHADMSLHWWHFGYPRMRSSFMRTTKTLIRLQGCVGQFQSSLGARPLIQPVCFEETFRSQNCSIFHSDNDRYTLITLHIFKTNLYFILDIFHISQICFRIHYQVKRWVD